MEKQKMSIVCNGEISTNIMPTLIFGSSAVALDYDVYIFFAPGGAKWTVKDELEKLGQPKGLPNPIKLFNDILDGGGHMTLCQLALENKGIDPKSLRDPRIKITPAPTYLMDVEGACQTYVF